MAGIAEQPERLVPAVINFGDDKRTAHYAGEFVIGVRRLREHIEIIAMEERVIQVAVFGAAVEAVGTAPEDDRERTPSRVAKLGGHAGRVSLDFGDGIDGGSHD